MAIFHKFVYTCTIHLLLNQVSNQYAFHLGQAQVQRKAHQNSNAYLKFRALSDLHLQKVHRPLQSYHGSAGYHNQYRYSVEEPALHHQQLINNIQESPRINEPSIQHKSPSLVNLHLAPNLANRRFEINPHDNHIPSNLHPRNDIVYQEKRNDIEIGDLNDRQPIANKKVSEIRMQKMSFGSNRQTFKHFRYSRIRRYYTLSTASMTTWKKLNYTTRLMYTTPTTPTTFRYTKPTPYAGSSRQTILHTRMTESDEIGKDLFMSGSIEYKDDSFDRPPTAMVAYDSLQRDSMKNGTDTEITDETTPSITTKPSTTSKSTKKISSELISMESSSEEKPVSSEAKDVTSSSENEDYANEKAYGEYGYHKKYNQTEYPFTIVTYANLREVPGMSEENLTSAEVAFWEANASYVMDKYFPPSALKEISNYSEENLVRSFFHHENIEDRYLDFYKWYYKLLIDPKRMQIAYNRTVLEEPDYKNLSQFTPYPIPEDAQRYFMFINMVENEIEHEKRQEERTLMVNREAEQSLDRILGGGDIGVGAGRAEGLPFKSVRQSNKKGNLDVSQILQMVDRQQADSLMPSDDESSEGFIEDSRYKRDVSKFEPD